MKERKHRGGVRLKQDERPVLQNLLCSGAYGRIFSSEGFFVGLGVKAESQQNFFMLETGWKTKSVLQR